MINKNGSVWRKVSCLPALILIVGGRFLLPKVSKSDLRRRVSLVFLGDPGGVVEIGEPWPGSFARLKILVLKP